MLRGPLFIVLIFLPLTTGATNLKSFLRCEQIASDSQRLTCFDQTLARLKRYDYQVPAAFLESEIRVAVDESEYALNIKKFLKLIRSARLKDKSSITVLGWQQPRDQLYQLDLILEMPVSVFFQFYPKKGFSLMKPVHYRDEQIHGEQFILVIAAMSGS